MLEDETSGSTVHEGSKFVNSEVGACVEDDRGGGEGDQKARLVGRMKN